jgi:hypothetical protein
LVEAFVDWFLFVIVTSTSTCDCLFVFLPFICPFAHLVYATSHTSYTQDSDKTCHKCLTPGHDVRTDIWSNKHEKGYTSRKDQPSVKSV